MGTWRCMFCVVWLVMASGAHAATVDLEPLLKALQSVGPKGAGNREAALAWQQVVRADADQLPVVLAAMDQAGPLGANWIRTAADTIAERLLRRDGQLPAAELQRFVNDTRHNPRARLVAYEWLVRVDPSARERLIPGMLNDASLELRREAVARLIDAAGELPEGDAAATYQRALSAARDHDQIKLLAGWLEKLGQAVDLPRHLGFIVRWKLIGPFDNTGEKGFDVAYPPERSVDPAAAYQGKHGAVGWIDYLSTDDYGQVDFNEALEEEKAVVGYATTEFICERGQEVEVRASSFTAIKFWVNGNLIAQHNTYHAGSQLDQFASRAVLEPGRNVILVKVCQNEQTQSWTRKWCFKLRVCDRQGGAVLSADRDKTSISD